MPRYIDADDLRDNVLNDNTYDNDTVNYYLGWIDDAPTADVVPVVRGEWIEHEDEMECPQCGYFWNYCDNDTERFNYCPNCGAKMEAKE